MSTLMAWKLSARSEWIEARSRWRIVALDGSRRRYHVAPWNLRGVQPVGRARWGAGDKVTLEGLHTTVSLNGREAVLMGAELPDGRWRIRHRDVTVTVAVEHLQWRGRQERPFTERGWLPVFGRGVTLPHGRGGACRTRTSTGNG